jgi:hypothetical protein
LASLFSQLRGIKNKIAHIKKAVMKQQNIHQELLVFTTTSLSRKILCETNSNDKNNNMTLAEKLEQACWNGLLNEMFPEIIGSGSTPSHKMFIWVIRTCKSCLHIDLADTPGVIDSILSVDPYLFLPELNLN